MRDGTVITSVKDNAVNGALRIISANVGANHAVSEEPELLKVKFKAKTVLGSGVIGVSKAGVSDAGGKEIQIHDLKSTAVKVLELTESTPPDWQNKSLAASDSSMGDVTLTWSGASDNVAVTAYKVYKDGVLLGKSVPGNVNSYKVSGLEHNASYLFKVEAGDAAGNWSTNGPSLNLLYKSAAAVLLKDSQGNP